MAASPLAAPQDSDHSSAKHQSSWNPMEVDSARDHMGPGGDLDLNGAAPPPDDRPVSAPEGSDYPPGAPTGNGTDGGAAATRADAPQRGEKIIKVLSRSLYFVPRLLPSLPLPSSPIALSAQ